MNLTFKTYCLSIIHYAVKRWSRKMTSSSVKYAFALYCVYSTLFLFDVFSFLNCVKHLQCSHFSPNFANLSKDSSFSVDKFGFFLLLLVQIPHFTSHHHHSDLKYKGKTLTGCIISAISCSLRNSALSFHRAYFSTPH